MRKNVLAFLLCLGIIGPISDQASAQGTLIHYWHFNNYSYGPMYTPSIAGIAADFSIHDTSKAKILYKELPGTPVTYSTFIDTVSTITADNDTMNLRMSQPSGLALRARNRSDSMQLLFYIPTVHYHNILLKYGVERTTNGAQLQNFDYSLDSGVTYITTGLSITSYSISAAHIFSLVSVAFPETVADNSKLVFRIQFTNGSTDTSGNDRFDNVTVDGDSLTHPASAPLIQSVVPTNYVLYPNPVINSLQINTASDEDKSLTIVNELGQTVYVGVSYGKSFTINTANLTAGCYYITIRESVTGDISTMKFIKQ